MQKRLLCNVVDDLADRNPDQFFCLVPADPGLPGEWKKVSMKHLANAVNYLSWFIDGHAEDSEYQECLTYIGANDIRYAIFLLACMKTGKTACFLSPKNSIVASKHILEATKCSTIFHSIERQSFIRDLEASLSDLRVLELPRIETMLSPIKAFPFDKKFRDVEDNAVVVIQSSGTTGLPKPVRLTHGYFGTLDWFNRLPIPQGRAAAFPSGAAKGHFLLATSPYFHMMGIMAIIESIFHNNPFIQCPDMPIIPSLLESVLDTTNAVKPTAIIAAPILEELSTTEKGIGVLKRFHTVFVGGAPLPRDAGNVLSQHLNLQNVMGSTETGLLVSLIQKNSEDWEYFEWAPAYGIEMRPVEGGGHELTIPRQENRDFHGIFHTFPRERLYRTNDVYEQHPTKKGLWRFMGRLDDVIVLRNGEKFNPSAMEEVIRSHPSISRAMIVGQGRFEAAVLVEPCWEEYAASPTEFINQIWPYIEKANEIAPGHAKLSKDRIAVASKTKPLQATPKGTLRRRAVLEDYEREINALYEQSENIILFKMPKKASMDEILNNIIQAMSTITGLPLEQVHQEKDFSSQGLDSLQILRLSRVVRSMIRALNADRDCRSINSQALYSCGNPEALAAFIHDFSSNKGSVEHLLAYNQSTRLKKIRVLIDKYTGGEFGSNTEIAEPGNFETHSVLITGSTGSLGCYLLYQILQDSLVTKIYCLNRSQDSEQKQRQSFKERGLTARFEDRVEFLRADLGSDRFGLTHEQYAVLLQTVDTIIHNAWMVNFNHPVEAFEHPHIEGVRRLVDFSRQSARNAHIHFVSSVAAVGAWTPDMGPSIPEAAIQDVRVCLPQGYGESKYIAEQILTAASTSARVPSTIYRVGQIAGPLSEKGKWNTQEWMPSLILTSKTLGMVPQSLGDMKVDWIPVDLLAKIMSELINARRLSEAQQVTAVFHLVNPDAVPWSSLVSLIERHYHVKLVDFDVWIKVLEDISDPTEEDLKNKPALKLLDFFRRLAVGDHMSVPFETIQACEASGEMRRLAPINVAMMERWIDQWRF